MAETHTVYDPFKGELATISSRLVDRLRGKYAVGPTLENGEPEFGWVQNKPIAIQVEAAAEIERLQALLEDARLYAAVCPVPAELTGPARIEMLERRHRIGMAGSGLKQEE